MCCTEDQWSFMIAYPLVSLSILLLWWSVVTRPLRIFSVVLHEFSHGVAVILSCGTIYDVSVNKYEGGLIKWAPRCILCLPFTFPLIAAAGYLGVAIFGSFLLLSTSIPMWKVGILRTFACLLVLASFVAARRPALRFESAWILLFGVLSIICSMRPEAPFTWYYTLFSSSMLCTYAAYDVYDDTVSRTLPESDASYFSLAICGNIARSRLVGIIWYVMCISFHLAAAILTFTRLGENGTDTDFSSISQTRFILFVWGLAASTLFSAIDVCRPKIQN